MKNLALEYGNENLTERLQIMEGNMQSLQIVTKEGKTALAYDLKTLEVFTIEKNKKVTDNMQALGQLTT